jgi:DNA replication protein DnaC
MSIELIGQLKALKLHGMAQSWPELMARARHHSLDAEQVMQELLAAETAEREVKSLAYQMKAARFPAHRDLAGFDFAQSQVDATLVRRLHEGTFMDSAQNVVLIGGPGTGKTHLATAIGVEAIQRHHRRVRFLSTVELVNALELEKAAGKQGQLAYRLTKAQSTTKSLIGLSVLYGALGGSRTPDHLVRSQVLYPAELPARTGGELW